MGVLVVIRSRRVPDDGVVLHFAGYAEGLRFAADWHRRHSVDRLTVFSRGLEPLVALDGYEERAQSGASASGTLS